MQKATNFGAETNQAPNWTIICHHWNTIDLQLKVSLLRNIKLILIKREKKRDDIANLSQVQSTILKNMSLSSMRFDSWIRIQMSDYRD